MFRFGIAKPHLRGALQVLKQAWNLLSGEEQAKNEVFHDLSSGFAQKRSANCHLELFRIGKRAPRRRSALHKAMHGLQQSAWTGYDARLPALAARACR